MFTRIATLFVLVPTCFAAGTVVQPSPANPQELERTSAVAVSYAELDVRGRGANLLFHYAAKEPIDAYIVYVHSDNSVNPRHIVRALLPAQEAGEVTIPLERTRGWKPGDLQLRIFLLTDDENPLVESVEITGRNSLSGLFQYFTPEPFTPSSYHRLQGYKTFGISATALLLIGVLLLALPLLMKKRYKAILVLFVLVSLAQNARFAVDTLHYSAANLRSWGAERTYAQAGSAYEIASYIHASGYRTIRLCTEGTSYFPVLLKYAVFPTVLNKDSRTVLVHSALDASYADGILSCGNIRHRAEPLKTFTDGSILFNLLLE